VGAFLPVGEANNEAKQESKNEMPKQKTHRGAKKRFKISGGGKVLRHHSMCSHIMTKKTRKRKRRLRRQAVTTGKMGRSVKEMLHG
jgi:large subunit ribosomal protein L35